MGKNIIRILGGTIVGMMMSLFITWTPDYLSLPRIHKEAIDPETKEFVDGALSAVEEELLFAPQYTRAPPRTQEPVEAPQ